MCPFGSLNAIVMYFLLLLSLYAITVRAAINATYTLPFKFYPPIVEVPMGEKREIKVVGLTSEVSKFDWVLEYERGREYVAEGPKSYLINVGDNETWTSVFDIKANFMGKTNVKLRAVAKNGTAYTSKTGADVTVLRRKNILDKIFNYSIILLAVILFIIFGCALDWVLMKEIAKKPIGPAIGFFCQFLCMPLFGFGLGKLLFPDIPEMQLGVFLTGLSPGGVASNMWTMLLGGNANLSVVMTTISTLASFGMIPLWLFTLGQGIFREARLTTPYAQIGQCLLGLVIPLTIGYLIQKFLPKLSKSLIRVLKPLSLFIIVFIAVFACITNTYIFQLFTWKIFVAGLGLPWLGYTMGYLTAWGLGQRFEDVLAIAIETGMQNTGFAIFMLRLSLNQPAADLTTVVPVAVSVMTPIPLSIMYIYFKCRSRLQPQRKLLVKEVLVNGNVAA